MTLTVRSDSPVSGQTPQKVKTCESRFACTSSSASDQRFVDSLISKSRVDCMTGEFQRIRYTCHGILHLTTPDIAPMFERGKGAANKIKVMSGLPQRNAVPDYREVIHCLTC